MTVAQGIKQSAADTIYDKTMANGGGTFMPNGFEYSGQRGYAVCQHESRGRAIHVMDFSPSTIHAWAIDNIEFLIEEQRTSDHLLTIGTWNDGDGFIHIDISTIVSTLDEALDLARAHNQLAIWSFGDNAEIRV